MTTCGCNTRSRRGPGNQADFAADAGALCRSRHGGSNLEATVCAAPILSLRHSGETPKPDLGIRGAHAETGAIPTIPSGIRGAAWQPAFAYRE